ncbi:protein ACTIVITY OF BC1 COMPLEX KINASE 1, chloroplastic-like [Magnolia sinica]|uniref:protein ACTIVITY OF BC1 COMPLEX KINASE 1, chloroplastic-like n=1 Tax=Magnolia sinica TaxID=86752 RepID=UPI00265B410D|nr:protein ACTIVITY OF BC1 COMPLEX KINASE 1, chloroplastic-like [Magnolia sinica]XP_058088581.1 protein ACTIVITY OF BC1 COMPLEX KINASE 1, chloroplastic-like [Magnolia sinica]
MLHQRNKQILIDAVVHAVNEDYVEMENDFTRLGFLASGIDVSPIIRALEAIWQNSVGKGLSDFNFRSVTAKQEKSARRCLFDSDRLNFDGQTTEKISKV